jgi:hypothetical protein
MSGAKEMSKADEFGERLTDRLKGLQMKYRAISGDMAALSKSGIGNMVELTVKLPENVAQSFGSDIETAARQLLESAEAEGYRSGKLSRRQLREMLDLSWHQTEEFLKGHGCELGYGVAELEKGRAALPNFMGDDFGGADTSPVNYLIQIGDRNPPSHC